MTLGVSIPSPRGSPLSDDSSQIQTPVSPLFPEAPSRAVEPGAPSMPGSSNNKRKASRRANTAERRATHNAVERARRETLNGRFLDLAGLLPNLSQIRRPSKSAIVNSSIAHIHASRRHRQLASRELRLLKLEADALRRELNDWRDRAGIPRVQEPTRGDGFSMILSGEIEVLPVPNIDEEEAEYVNGDEEGHAYVSRTPANEQEAYSFSFNDTPMNSNVRPNLPPDQRPPPNGVDISVEQQMMRRGARPMVAISGGMAVENPAVGLMYANMSYPAPFVGDHNMDQNKWPGPSIDEQDVTQTGRSRATSASSTGSGSPSHIAYYDPGWNATMGGMAPNMGTMLGGGGSNGGTTTFAMM